MKCIYPWCKYEVSEFSGFQDIEREVGSGRFTLEMDSSWKMMNFGIFKNFLRSLLRILASCFQVPYVTVEGALFARNQWIAENVQITARHVQINNANHSLVLTREK